MYPAPLPLVQTPTSFIRRLEAPAFEPIEQETVEAFLKVEDGQDTNVIAALIAAAVAWGEKYTNHAFALATYEANIASFEFTNHIGLRGFDIPTAPFGALTSVEAQIDGSLVAVAGVQIAQWNGATRFFFPTSFDQGALDQTAAYPFRVVFTAGYAEGELPPEIHQAVQHHVAYMYENRGDVAGDFKDAVAKVPDITLTLYNMVRAIPGFG